MNVMDKMESVIDNVSRKIQSLNGLFNVIDYISDGLTSVTDKVVDGVMGVFNKVVHKKSKKNKIKEEEE